MRFPNVYTAILYTFQDDIFLCENLHLQRFEFVKIHVYKIHTDKKGRG